jgi:hypothetical protein
MTCSRVRLGDTGTTFRATIKDGLTVVDVSSASGPGTKQFYLKGPTGATKPVNASFATDGTDGVIEYITGSGDLDEEGTWRWQAKVELSSGTWKSEIQTFEVEGVLL